MYRLIIYAALIALFSSCQNPTDSNGLQNGDSSTIAATKFLSQISPADTGSAEPYLFTDPKGNVYLSWIEKKQGISSLKFSRLETNTWSLPITISSGANWFVNWADYPQLSSTGDGNMIAHFLEKSAGGTYTYDIKFVSSIDSGKTWSSSRILHDDGIKAEHGFVSIAPIDQRFFLAWLDGRNTISQGKGGHSNHHQGQMSLRGTFMDRSSTKSGEVELDNRVCDCCRTSAAITENGPVVVYRDRSADEVRDISIVRFVNGKWTDPVNIFQDHWKINGCPVNGPRISANGNIVAVAWFTGEGSNPRVQVSFSENGGETFKHPIRVDEGNGIGRVDVELLDKTSAMVSWMEGSTVKAVRVFENGKKDSSLTIATSTASRSGGFPQITRSGNRIIFAWTDDKLRTVKVGVVGM